ncbi:MAG TPA: GntR family transcriptional regulator [Burkholderiaceae bacterium]|nr:GntR family transcriptional regulator [Burkholderiaceae bacterium]
MTPANHASRPGSDVAAGEPKSRSGRAAEIRATLQDEIESGKLGPGSTLDERALAERFGVSRTPVREALQQLAARGLVRVAPRHGVHVARLSIGKVRAILEYIAELEAICAKLAARRVDEELRRALDAAIAKCEAAAANGATGEYAVANTVFHEAIYAGSRNEYLAEQIRAARRLIQRYRVRDFQTKSQITRSLEDHRRIAHAIQAGDEAEAERAMFLHVPAGTTSFSEFLATVPMSFFESDAGLEG